jgi:hypothetical protein
MESETMAHIRLHVQQADGRLPMVCMRCGEPATVVKTKMMSYYPRWLILLVLGGLPGLIVLAVLALALRKRARLQTPLCDQHQGHWTIRLAIGWAAAVGFVVAAIATVGAFIMLENAGPRNADVFAPFVCIGGMFVFLGLLILIVIVHSTSIRPDEITRTHILLNGVSDAFVTAVEEAEIERRVRLRRWEYEDEADRAPRRRASDVDESLPQKAASVDASEEDRPRPAPPAEAFEAENDKDDKKGPPAKEP